MNDFKLNKDEILYTTYYNNKQELTHILCKKLNTDMDKMWILLSIEKNGSLKKVSVGSNPLKLENKIDYIKEVKER